MAIDSYRWLPQSIADTYRRWPAERLEPIPWTRLPEPLSELTLGLVTTAGLYVEDADRPFDAERERREPMWGDPSWRAIPREVAREGIGASHLHVNNAFVRRDINVALPLDPAEEAVAEGALGEVAETHYSLMGFQLDTTAWEQRYVPQVAERLQAEGTHVALITPV